MEELYSRVVAGCEQAKAQMIEAHLGLAYSKVKRLLKKVPALKYLREDLVAEGNLAVVEAVNNLVGSELGDRKENPTGYISIHVTYAMARFVDSVEGGGTISGEARRRRRREGRGVPTQDEIPDLLESDPGGLIDTWDDLLACCKDPEDREILRLKAEGHTGRSISRTLGMSHAEVHKRLHGIHKRYTVIAKRD